jgi:hypothetical protein
VDAVSQHDLKAYQKQLLVYGIAYAGDVERMATGYIRKIDVRYVGLLQFIQYS